MTNVSDLLALIDVYPDYIVLAGGEPILEIRVSHEKKLIELNPEK